MSERLSISLKKELKEKIEREADNQKRSLSSIVHHALEIYFETESDTALKDRVSSIENQLDTQVSELASDIHTLQRELAVLRSAVSDIVLKFERLPPTSLDKTQKGG